ncbi:hypothetical protein DER30_4958 [Streptomyces sp. HB202]|nr:hypothetical protein DER30_4958 [Streptomyces sp. HB202]
MVEMSANSPVRAAIRAATAWMSDALNSQACLRT